MVKRKIAEVVEGTTTLFVPEKELKRGEKGQPTLPKTPIFYNPLMELSRDLSIIVVQVHQRERTCPLSFCDALAATGARGIRIAKEVKGIWRAVLNDLNSSAVEFIKLNVSLNQLDYKVLIRHMDANLLLSSSFFDIVDIDPFGSPAPYLNSALRALRSGGLLCVTATDMGVLCGRKVEACKRKYKAKPLNTEYCHEIAVRILIGTIARTAAVHELYIKPILVHSTNHYIRVYLEVGRSKELIKQSLSSSYIIHCKNCGYRKLIEQMNTETFDTKLCPLCSNKMNFSGPLWGGSLYHHDFCDKVLKETKSREINTKQKLIKMLETILEESQTPSSPLPLFYDIHKICKKIKIEAPPIKTIITELKNQNYQASRTHFKPTAIRTNASIETIKETIKKLVKKP
ncbi:MAG: tRNA (guanine(10)-N(2))-dimethyltransferase [Candidatus Hodarchaeota archaeon]